MNQVERFLELVVNHVRRTAVRLNLLDVLKDRAGPVPGSSDRPRHLETDQGRLHRHVDFSAPRSADPSS